MSAPRGLSVFVSYAREDNEGEHADLRWLGRVLQVLKPLALQEEVSAFSEQDFLGGDDWQKRARALLASAHAAVLLAIYAALLTVATSSLRKSMLRNASSSIASIGSSSPVE